MAIPSFPFTSADLRWQDRLSLIVETMRELSRQTDPQAMVRAYGSRMRQLLPTDRMISISRRDLDPHKFRITRSSLWKEEINPWKEKDRLPILQGGLLGELIYGDTPRIINQVEVHPDDPAREYLDGFRSLIAIPNFDQGVALNMVVFMRRDADGFTAEQLPEWVWMSNLFGRATHNLVLAEDLQRAYEAVDHEMQVVADIQRSLLPAQLPCIPNMDVAAYYQTSRQAGGDYYDFFPLPDGKWGILITDVSGHGTPAAVIMAVTHTIAHTYPGSPAPPGKLLGYVNHHLTSRYTTGNGSFVTAFYGIFDPQRRELTYACAGHNPPRLKHCGARSVSALNQVAGLPMGITDERYAESTQTLQPGDQLIFYTDGITEAQNRDGEMFGLQRLDAVLGGCGRQANELLSSVLRALEVFTENRPADDDRTLLLATIL